ncbi:type VII secretion-associated serine protease mycosin [Mycobacterium sp.]|uniref:type VII secretion-associated serine protease mycosin n=1 Tax=Mycobacterium sp. TaxID=1785 RepID=UPI001281A621|nr:type VII secretion-associated serine protease mycosin [Mycobacterium sp.]KAA8966164.1 MAG: type VII secretion-associated serine protease mycosin [Mycobacterium sp.]
MLLLVALGATAPPAHAVAPPPIDDSLLPRPAPPAPPQRTVQRQTCAVPSMDPGARGQLDGLDLPRVWQLSRGSGQRVAVIDTGVSPHPRLPATAAGGDYVFSGDGRQDCDGHGTAVAGIIAAAPGDGFSGVAPDVSLISIRQASTRFGAAADPSGSGVGDVDTLAKAVRTAADLGASVINISSVACVPAESGLDDRALGAALAYAVDVKNAVVVAAAGNTGGPGHCPAQPPGKAGNTAALAVSPAWYDDYVLTVGSVDARGAPSTFTLPGPWVDVAAPGEAAVSLSLSGRGLVNAFGAEGQSTPLSGTSYAAPVVSGLAALIRSRFPALTPRQVMRRIEATAHHPPAGWDPFVGHGVVDVLAAVSSEAPERRTPARSGTAVPIAPAPTVSAPPDRGGARVTAFVGAAVCLSGLAVALLSGVVAARLRRIRRRAIPDADGVAGD